MTRQGKLYSIKSMGATFSISNIARAISIGIRILITGLGAVVLMLLVSYPSVLTAQEPLITLPNISQEFLFEWRNWLWVAPWLLMEIAAIAGPRRNLVWFSGLIGVIALTMVAYPIIQATRPELIHPHFYDWVHATSLKEELDGIEELIIAINSPYRDKCLAFGFPILWVLLGLSVFVRLVLLKQLVRLQEVRDENEFNSVDVADISPDAENARTVKEIAATPQKVKAEFKFGEADQGLVAKIRAMLQRLQYLRTVKGICWLSAALALVLWFILYPMPNEQQALQRDLKAMYETTTDAEGNELGTTRAVYAALRVMDYVVENRSLDNITVAEAEKWLGLHQASPNYRKMIRNEDLQELEFRPDRLRTGVPYARFLTITDGRHHAVMMLNLRTNETDPATDAPLIQPNTMINFPQYFEFGWDHAQDKRRSFPYLYEGIQFKNAIWM